MNSDNVKTELLISTTNVSIKFYFLIFFWKLNIIYKFQVSYKIIEIFLTEYNVNKNCKQVTIPSYLLR